MQFLFAFFMIYFFVRNLLVYLLIKLLDSSCVLFFLVTIFVCRTIRNKSELKAKTGRDRLETENDCCVLKSALRLKDKQSHRSLFTLPGDRKSVV